MKQEINILTMIEQFDLTPAEAVDYHAVENEGYTQAEWANKRGLDGYQSVGRNAREGRKKLKDPRNIIDTVVVDPDDIIEALRYNGRPGGYQNQRSAVLRITPPFEAEAEASIFYDERGNYYPPEMNTHPIHIDPQVFIGENTVNQPLRYAEKERAEEELDDPTQEDIEEYIEFAFEVWEDDVRSSLLKETDINDSKRRQWEEHVVTVKYS